jgi:O-antigen chain-terminating methyltransferase
MAENCRARGLRIVEADALTHLRSLPEKSVAAVCGFHIIEHLAIEEMIQLFVETIRVLLPGGVALFETPNPENVLVGSHLFYTDPTHARPLPSSMLHFLFEATGFESVTVTPLHPREADTLTPRDSADQLTERFNHLFYGPMDYSISGRKPAA